MNDESKGGRKSGSRRPGRFTSRRMAATVAGLTMLTVLAGAAAAEPVVEPRLHEEVQALVDHLAARPVDCPTELLAPDIVDRTYCAEIDLAFKPLRKAVLKFIRTNQNAGTAQLGEWSGLDGGLHATPLLLGSLVVRMVFDTQTATLLLIPHDGCVEGSGAMSPGVFEWAAVGVVKPERLEFHVPEFPERARAFRVTGVVVLQAVVRKNGTTGEHCVLYAQPRGYGFVESAMSALKRARYKPATLDGEPVEIVATVASSFTYGR